MSKAEARQDTFSEYRATDALNFSRLKRIAKSPLDYKTDAPKYTTALGIGRAIHTAVLEPDKWQSEYAIFDGDKRTKLYKEFKAANSDREILGHKDALICESIACSVRNHPVAASYFESGQAEVSIEWEHALGVRCKSRLDWLSDDIVLDLKSTADITPDGFARACARYSYHGQLSFYCQAAKALDGRERKAVILAVEKEPPYDIAPYVLPEEAMQAGRRLVTDWLLKVQECQERGHWPGVAEQETELQLPDWCFSEWDDATLVIDGIEMTA